LELELVEANKICFSHVFIGWLILTFAVY